MDFDGTLILVSHDRDFLDGLINKIYEFGGPKISYENMLIKCNDGKLKVYNIPLDYNEDICNLTPRAFKGEAGIFTHNSVRPDKVDIYPHPKLIEMLKSL